MRRTLVTLVAAAMAVGACPAHAAAGPTLRWHLDTAPGGVTPDSSGNGLDGTLRAAAELVPDGRFDGAVRLPLPDPPAGTGVTTASDARLETPHVGAVLWLRPPTDDGPLLRYGGACGTPAWSLDVIGGDIRFQVSVPNGGTMSTTVSANYLNAGWNGLAVSYDGTTPSVYVNSANATGSITGSISGPIQYPAAAHPGLTLGAPRDCEDSNATTSVDELSVYPDALTGAEASYLSNPLHTVAPALPPAPIGQTDLLAQYHLDEDGAATVALDSSGYALHGRNRFSPGGAVPGRFGTALRLDGQDLGEGFEVDAAPQPDRLTALAWVRAAASPGPGRTVLALGAGNDSEGSPICDQEVWSLDTGTDGGLRFRAKLADADGNPNAPTTPEVPAATIWDGAWHAVAGVYDGNRVVVYVDGHEAASHTQTGVVSFDYGGNQPLLAGHACGGQTFSGDLDEVRLYDRALSTDELAALQSAAATAPPVLESNGKPALRWHLDDFAANNVTPDDSGNGLDGFVLAGTPIDGGRFGRAFRLLAGGADSGIRTGANPHLEAPSLSVLAWVRSAGAPSTGDLLSYGRAQDTCGRPQGYRLRVEAGTLSFAAGNEDGAAVSAATAFPDAGWHLLAGTITNDRTVLYRDGGILATGPGSTVRYRGGTGFAVGNAGDACHGPNSNADIDEARVYPRALTAAEVAELADSTATVPPELGGEPEPGLKLKWHLNGIADDGSVHDSSGSGFDGSTRLVSTISPARFGAGLAISAPPTGDTAPVGAGRDATPGLEIAHPTLMAWVRRSASDRNGVIVGYGAGAACDDPGYGLVMTADGSVGFAAATPGAASHVTAGAALSDGQWHAVAGTYDGSKLRLYVDGAPVGDGTATGPSIRYDQLSTHGFRAGDSPRPSCTPRPAFTGDLDEIRVYDHPLTGTEIAYLQAGFHRKPPTLPIPAGPANLTRPALSGVPSVGTMLTCVPGTWSGNPTGFTYLWERAPRTTRVDGDDAWAAIAGATGTTFTLTAAEESARIRCREIATNASGSGEAVSPSKRVDVAAPTYTVAPSVTGTPVQGHVLTCEHGTWTGGPDESDFSYQWVHDGLVIPGATQRTYTLKRRRGVQDDAEPVTTYTVIDAQGDGDRQVGCVVVASNDVGASAAAATPTLHAVDDEPRVAEAPTVTLSDDPNPLQQTATCHRGRWYNDYSDQPGYDDAYQWYRTSDPASTTDEGTPIAGATGPTFKLTADVLGRYIRCRVVPRNIVGPAGDLFDFSTGGFVGSSKLLFIPLPVGQPKGQIEALYRDNRYDPANLLATSNDYLQASAQLTIRLLERSVAELTNACPTDAASFAGLGAPTSWPLRLDLAKPLNVRMACLVLRKHPGDLHYTTYGVFWDPGNGCLLQLSVDGCINLGVSVQPVNAATVDALPPADAAALKDLTPVRVLWDIDNDGRTDISCPGSSPVIRTQLEPGGYMPKAVIVNPDSEQTGVFIQAGANLISPRFPGRFTSSIGYPNDAAKSTKGRLRNGQPLWCRTSLAPPPDPETAPCVSSATIGRVQVTGDMCPVNVRGIDDAELAALPDDVREVVHRAAQVINDNEAALEKTRPGYSPGTRWTSLTARALPSPADRALAAAGINTAATLSALDTARRQAQSTAKSYVDQKIDTALKTLPSTTNLKQQATSFATDQIYIARNKLNLNGVNIDPTGKLHTLIVPSDINAALPSVHQMTLVSQEAEAYLKAPEDAAKKAANIEINKAKKEFKAQLDDKVDQAKTYLKDQFNLKDIEDKLDLGPFKLTGTKASVEINKDGTATLHADAKFPGLTSAIAPPSKPNSKAGDPITIKVDLNADLTGRIKLQGLNLKIPKAYLVGVQLENLYLIYNDKGLDAGGLITFPLSGGEGIDVSHFRLDGNGDFAGLQVSYLAGAGKGVLVAPGLFLTRIGGGFSKDPYEIYGNAALSVVAPSAGGGCPTAGLDGNLTFHWSPVPLFVDIQGHVSLVCIPLANVSLHADETGWVTAHGDVNFSVPLIADVNGQVNGSLKVDPDNLWQVDAHGTLDSQLLPLKHLEAKGAISNRGMAACASVVIDLLVDKIHLSAGAAVRFPGGRPPLTFPELLADFRAFLGCDIGAYTPLRAVRLGRAASAAQAFQLSHDGVVLSLQGAGAVPKVKLTSPSGKVFDYSALTSGTVVNGTLGAPDEKEGRLVVILPRPEAGGWKAEVVDGSPAIARIETAPLLPAPVVKAKVTGSGSHRVLHYRIKRIAGQQVAFVETATSGHKVLKVVTGGGTGSFRYTLGETRSAKRTIEAEVSQNGLPRRRLEVAHYVAANPRVGRPRVHVKRRGTGARVTWTRIAQALRYDVTARYADGRTLLFQARGRSLTVPRVGARRGVVVRVVAVTLAGRQSRPGVARLRAVRHKRH